ncbi:hypothetical protein FB45DRAFT_1008932 [Roridomyces roridus]|uniref:Uncharacterized protein n=1 Tax=Roridomyces roridus TaxID=1738132 RepID=A0AAD7FDA4_9AGAR|nr:hypothetical protein FB45DRAFT_1008932 [Roridomyces roridus]
MKVVIAIAIARPHSTMATASVKTLPLLVVSPPGNGSERTLSCLSNEWDFAGFILSAVRTDSEVLKFWRSHVCRRRVTSGEALPMSAFHLAGARKKEAIHLSELMVFSLSFVLWMWVSDESFDMEAGHHSIRCLVKTATRSLRLYLGETADDDLTNPPARLGQRHFCGWEWQFLPRLWGHFPRTRQRRDFPSPTWVGARLNETHWSGRHPASGTGDAILEKQLGKVSSQYCRPEAASRRADSEGRTPIRFTVRISIAVHGHNPVFAPHRRLVYYLEQVPRMELSDIECILYSTLNKWPGRRLQASRREGGGICGRRTVPWFNFVTSTDRDLDHAIKVKVEVETPSEL